jgi:hypothetical protein
LNDINIEKYPNKIYLYLRISVNDCPKDSFGEAISFFANDHDANGKKDLAKSVFKRPNHHH